MKAILKAYESASRQPVNIKKSAVFFTPSLSKKVRNGTMEILDIHTPLGRGKYLGLPSLIGRKKKGVCFS